MALCVASTHVCTFQHERGLLMTSTLTQPRVIADAANSLDRRLYIHEFPKVT